MYTVKSLIDALQEYEPTVEVRLLIVPLLRTGRYEVVNITNLTCMDHADSDGAPLVLIKGD